MFFTYVYRELRRRHRQALLTALGLAVGVALVVAVTAYAGGVSNAQTEVLQSLYGVGTDITVSQTRQTDDGGPQRFGMRPPDGEPPADGRIDRTMIRAGMGQDVIAEEKLTTIAGLDGVAAATGSLSLTSTHVSGTIDQSQGGGGGFGGGGAAQSGGASGVSTVDITSFSIAGVDVGDLKLGPLSAGQIASGRSLSSDDTNAKVALITKAYAKQNELTAGDTVEIDTTKFKVVGVVTLPAGSASSEVYIPLARAQKLSDNTDKVNQIYVRADSAENIAAVQASIKDVMPKATVTTSADLADQVSGSLSSASELADRLSKWLTAAALLASFAVACLLTVAAVSRRVREFGTLKALGWKSRRITGQVLGESFVVGIVGGLLGVVLGVLGARLVAGFSPALEATVGNAVQLPPGAPAGLGRAFGDAAQTVSVQLTAPVSLQLVAVAVALALAGALLAGAIGGWRASRLRPADALRRVD